MKLNTIKHFFQTYENASFRSHPNFSSEAPNGVVCGNYRRDPGGGGETEPLTTIASHQLSGNTIISMAIRQNYRVNSKWDSRKLVCTRTIWRIGWIALWWFEEKGCFLPFLPNLDYLFHLLWNLFVLSLFPFSGFLWIY